MAVEQVELESPITDIDCRRDLDPPYAAAWILVRRGGKPLGSLELELTEGRVPAAVIEEAVRTQISGMGRRQSRPDPDQLPSATVVVPTTMSRREQLGLCVEHLRRLDYPNFEIIVVDNRPLTEPAVELPGVRVIREPRPGISAARNAGLAVATGEILACTDDDVEVDKGWLLALGERFVSEPAVSAVTGLVVPRELETPAQIWFEESGLGLDRQYSPLSFERHGRFEVKRIAADDASERVHSLYKTGEFGLGSNMAFRTAVLEAAGGFDVALGAGTPTHGGEDLAILVELIASGHKLAYEPAAIAFHTHRRTTEELRRQVSGYGVGFTAMLTAISLRNPWHLVGLIRVIPAWLRSLRDPKAPKHVNRSDSYPSDLGRMEIRGMVIGPYSYMRSRRKQRRQQS